MNELVNIYIINGKKFECNLYEPRLTELIEKFLNVDVDTNSMIAIAVNNELIQRSKWNKTIVKLNDKIEIVAPFFGG
tara:strand:+ start:349 stop:579 length:231 start_codon:yes stop_codon:yes gene_type:complete